MGLQIYKHIFGNRYFLQRNDSKSILWLECSLSNKCLFHMYYLSWLICSSFHEELISQESPASSSSPRKALFPLLCCNPSPTSSRFVQVFFFGFLEFFSSGFLWILRCVLFHPLSLVSAHFYVLSSWRTNRLWIFWFRTWNVTKLQQKRRLIKSPVWW